jgi:hypothetical protein
MVRNPRQQDWSLGYDLRVDTPPTVRRSISFYEQWDDSRIMQRGAIHFCSSECKENYVAANSMARKMPARKAQRRRSEAA